MPNQQQAIGIDVRFFGGSYMFGTDDWRVTSHPRAPTRHHYLGLKPGSRKSWTQPTAANDKRYAQ
jgi:hypothetical protein